MERASSASSAERLRKLKLKADEGEGAVLDNSCLMFINNFWSGSKLETTRVPVLLAGGVGGSLKTGRVLDDGK